jgi:hypothetical protein
MSWENVGVVCGVVSLTWAIFTWGRDSPRLRVRYVINAVHASDVGIVKRFLAEINQLHVKVNDNHTCIEIANIGKRPTTLVLICLTNRTRESPLLRREKLYIFTQKKNEILLPSPLPYCLEPGKIWRGVFIEPASLKDINTQKIFLEVHHSYHDQPYLIRLKPDYEVPLVSEYIQARLTAKERAGRWP